VKSIKFYTAPAIARTIIMCPTENENLLSEEDQSKNRSRVGMLLHLNKHSRPYIANTVSKLSKVEDGATKDH